MLGELLAFVRQGDVQAVHSLRRGVAEALEIVVRGDRKSSRVVGRKVSELPCRAMCTSASSCVVCPTTRRLP